MRNRIKRYSAAVWRFVRPRLPGVAHSMIFVVGCTLVALPTTSVFFADYGHPTVAKWTRGKATGVRVDSHRQICTTRYERKAKIEFQTDLKQTLPRLYRHIPVPGHPGMWTCWILGCVLFMVFVFVALGRFRDDTFRTEKWIGVHLAFIQVASIAALTIIAAGFADSDTVTSGLKAVIHDRELFHEAFALYKSALPEIAGLGLFVAFLATDIVTAILVIIVAFSLEWFSDRYNSAKFSIEWRVKDRAWARIGESQRYTTVAVKAAHGADLQEFMVSMRWFPWPHAIVERKVLGTVGEQDVFDALVGPSRELTLRGLGEGLRGAFRTRLGEAGNQAARAVVRSIVNLVRSAAGHPERLLKEKHDPGVARAEEILTRVTDTTLERFRGAVVADARERLDQSLAAFRERLLGRVVEIAATGASAHMEGASLNEVLPDHTKFVFSGNGGATIVIEEPPQIRNVFVDGVILRPQTREHHVPVTLAFPYLVFVIRVWRGQISHFRVYYRTRPLQSLDDELLQANVPNMDPTGSICLGDGFRRLAAKGFAPRITEALNYFWSSEFNDHLPHYMVRMGERDPRLGSIEAWRDASAADPRFMLGVAWSHHERFPRFREAIEALQGVGLGIDMGEITRLANEALGEETRRLGDLVREFCASAKVEGRFPRTIAEELAGELEAATRAYGTELVERLLALVGKNDLEVFERFTQEAICAALETMDTEFTGLAKQVRLEREVSFDRLLLRIQELVNERAQQPQNRLRRAA